MAEFKAVFFDLDGTLVETSFEITDSVNDTLVNYGYKKVTETLCKSWIGHGTVHLMLKAISNATGERLELVEKDTKFKEIYAYFRECYAKRAGTNSWLFNGATNLLKALRENNIKTAIITNKEEAFTKKIINTHNLREVIDIVISGDTLPVKKPNPEGIFHAMSTLKIKSLDDILFIGDSDTDVKAAQNANVQCWAVPYGYNAGMPIEDSKPTKMIETLEDIKQIL